MCQLSGDSHVVARRRDGHARRDRFLVLYPLAGCTTWTVAEMTIVYDYDAASDTLVDSTGVTWRPAP